MTTRRVLTSLVLSSALLLAACGASKGSGGGSGTSARTAAKDGAITILRATDFDGWDPDGAKLVATLPNVLEGLVRVAHDFDLFGQESSYCFGPTFTGMPNDGGRVRYLRALMDAGLADRLLVSQDICTCVHLTRHGGEGLNHLLSRAVPLMYRMGLSEHDVQQLLACNPARALTGDEP